MEAAPVTGGAADPKHRPRPDGLVEAEDAPDPPLPIAPVDQDASRDPADPRNMVDPFDARDPFDPDPIDRLNPIHSLDSIDQENPDDPGRPVDQPDPGDPPGSSDPQDSTDVDALEAVRRALAADPASFGFFQAVRLLERLHPERARVGRFAPPEDEVVRLGVNHSLAFPPAEIHDLRWPVGGPPAMRVNFLGLTGPQGVLPSHYTVLAAERAGSRKQPSALPAFLDLFHHRALSLFYRAWEKHRVAVPAERGESDPLRRRLLDFVGEGGGEDALADALVHGAGLLAAVPRGAAGLEQLVEQTFGVPAEVEQFVGRWVPLADADRCRLGDDDEGAGRQLGLAVAGDEAWHAQSGIRLRLGPLARRDFDRFLPAGDAYPLLRRLVRFYTHDQFDGELRLVLRREDVPACVLGADTAPPLGWSTWARSRPPVRDADDTVLPL